MPTELRYMLLLSSNILRTYYQILLLSNDVNNVLGFHILRFNYD